MVCLLLQGSPGITKDLTIRNIQHILLKAFCAENRINTVQVAVDLSFLRFVCQLAGRSAEVAAGDKTDGADYNLILIEVSSVIIVYVQSQSPNIFVLFGMTVYCLCYAYLKMEHFQPHACTGTAHFIVL